MPSFRFLALVAVAAALVVVAPAIGDSGAARQSAVPPAEAAGGDAAPLLPSIVNTRLVRAQAALGRATANFDENLAVQAVVPMGAAVDNLTKGWNAEKWVIQTTPPPPADDAFPDGDGGAVVYAGPEDTAFAVFSAQHDLVSTSVGMMETANAALLKRLSSAISSVQATRTAAINYIHSIAPPPEDDAAIVDGTEGGATWATVMPTLVPLLDDEIQQVSGRLALYKFSASAKTALVNARSRAQNAKALVNQYWPPVTDD
jgi:hypothetical protein